MHDVFEIGFREIVSEVAIKDFLASYFNLDRLSIVKESEYWSDAWTGSPRVGVSIEVGVEGLKTNISGVSFQAIDDAVLEDLARKAAEVFHSEAVIGDFRKHGNEAIGRFLSYLPDGSVWESVDSSGGSVNDVMLIRKI